MSKYVEIGYPIYEGMPVYPGLPEVELVPRERIEKGDYWNGTVLSIYLHAGTHVDAPWHYVPGAPGIDAIPIENFIYNRPLLLDVPAQKPNDLITIEQLKEYGDSLYEADMLIFNTHYWKYRAKDFMKYATGFPAVSPEAAEFIRRELPNCKAVAIDTLSIENIEQGKTNGFRTHNAFLDPEKYDTPTILIYEDINPEPLIGKKLLRAFTAPLRILDHDASVVNIIVEVE
ncbi:MAG TPA: cyclase family protein [Firmicutes bacterium]|nr:cyclase family protein [Bacillota bacterium]